MKSTVAIILLILISMLSCMLPLRYGLKRAAKAVMNERMESGMKEEQVLIAESSLANAEWEDAHEFRLDGQLYDVAGVEFRNGVKYFRCVTDALETQVEHTADGITFHLSSSGRAKGREQIAQAFSDWLQGLYHSSTPQFRIACRPADVGRQFLTGPGKAMEDPFFRSIIIPPEV